MRNNSPKYSVDEVIKALQLEPHVKEGGFFRETYRAREEVAELPIRYKGTRTLSTAIYFFLTQSATSGLHRLQSDEIFHFYAGDPVELFCISPEGKKETIVLGADFLDGQVPQHVVSRGTWQGLRLRDEDAEYALLGTTVAPGFEFEDFEIAVTSHLLEQFPHFSDEIQRFTNEFNPKNN